MSDMMRQYFVTLEASLAAKAAAPDARLNARRFFALEIARLGRRLFEPGEKMAWCGVFAPFDLLNAMGVNSCFVEFVGAMLASAGAATPMLQHAEQNGYASDSCAYHRAVLGAAMQGLMPRPEFLVATTAPCAGGLATIENLARLYGKDLFTLHMPYGDDESAVRYLAAQIREMAGFVAAHTGNPLAADRLDEAVAWTNRARAVIVEVYELARRVPSPLNNKDLKDFGIVMALFLGTETGLRIAEAYRDELQARAAALAAVPPRRQVRLMWIQNRIQFKNPLIDVLEQKYGATIVVDELNSVWWDPIDPADPYTGFAKRMLSLPFGPRLDRLRQLARDYRIDAAINPCHWGCRQGTGARGLIQRGLAEAGVPTLNLEVDCVDSRNFSLGQLETRLDAFFEMLSR
jgi:benzoyl-CoA reductase/2-hydroxyglutaryl-CoA dehydratase subunit BcrC/BadD/HgdB